MSYAQRVTDGSVTQFLPSLYLNFGKSYEDLGNPGDARRHYESAAAKLEAIPAGAYRDIVQDGIERGLERVAASTSGLNAV
jgi:hypothetical protein